MKRILILKWMRKPKRSYEMLTKKPKKKKTTSSLTKYSKIARTSLHTKKKLKSNQNENASSLSMK